MIEEGAEEGKRNGTQSGEMEEKKTKKKKHMTGQSSQSEKHLDDLI